MNEGSAECLIALDTMACISSEVNVHLAASMVNTLKLGGDVWNLSPELELELGLAFVKSRVPASGTRERDSRDEFDPSRLWDLKLEELDALQYGLRGPFGRGGRVGIRRASDGQNMVGAGNVEAVSGGRAGSMTG